jgi:hypothetical protein
MPSRLCSVRTKSVVLDVSLREIMPYADVQKATSVFAGRRVKKHVCVSRIWQALWGLMACRAYKILLYGVRGHDVYLRRNARVRGEEMRPSIELTQATGFRAAPEFVR